MTGPRGGSRPTVPVGSGGGAAEPPRVAGAWLDAPATQGVMAALAGGGHRALVVGGCVRNALLGVPVADVDLATDAVPERVSALAKAAGMKAVPTGIAHGTVTVVSGGVPHEVTTFRRDVETDGRHAVVAFSGEVAEDAARRDFTMNALYAEACGRLVDPLGGLPDLLARRLRFVGDPEARIREDHLRILRFFRFHAWYGRGALDAQGLAACARLAGGVDRLSGERVGSEMKRLLGAPDPGPSLLAMEDADVLGRVAPGADPSAVEPLVAVEAGRTLSWQRRLVAMGGDDVSGRWRLSRAEARALGVRREALERGMSPQEVAWRHGVDAALDVALVRAASGGPGPPGGGALEPRPAAGRARARHEGGSREAARPDPPSHVSTRAAEGGGAVPPDLDDTLARAAAATFPLRAADLMPALSGPALGAALKKAEAAWIASGFALGRDELMRLVLGT